jgi:hypothetical protein
MQCERDLECKMPLNIGGVEINSTRVKYIADTSIITSGLVLNLDATNTLSYPGTGTTWNDLSGVIGNVNINNRNNDWSFRIDPTTKLYCVYNETNRSTGNNPGIDIPNNNGFNKLTGTIELWVKPGEATGGHGFFNNSDGSFYTNASNWFWFGTWDTSSIVYFRQGNPNTCCNDLTVSSWRSTYYVENVWINIGITWNVSAGRVAIYRNGLLLNSRSNMPTDIPNTNPTTTAQIFNGHTRSDNMQFKGYCSQYRIYNTELTASQMYQNFSAERILHGV